VTFSFLNGFESLRFSADVSLFLQSQFSFEMGSPATTVSIKSLAFIKRKTALVLPVQLIRHNKPYFS
jgi:hypothetical protein